MSASVCPRCGSKLKIGKATARWVFWVCVNNGCGYVTHEEQGR